MSKFDLLFCNYKKHIDVYIDMYDKLPDNPTLGQYLELRSVYYLSRQAKRDIKKAMEADSSLKVHLKDVLDYKFYKIPEFEPIKQFEHVIKLRDRREVSLNLVVSQTRKTQNNLKYISTLNDYCNRLDELERNTKLSEKFPKATARPLPAQADLIKMYKTSEVADANVA